MNDSQFQPKNAWYKTGGGVVFLGVLGMAGVVFLIFGGFVAYYVYQIAQGNGAELARQFQEENSFSTVSGADNGSIEEGIDPTPYIRPLNPQFGNTSSDIKIIAFIDFECPYCQRAFPIFESIRNQYESGVHIVFKHYPLSSIHPLATRAGLATSCAEEQDAFWPYYQQLFETKALSKQALLDSAAAIGLDMPTFTVCLDTARYQSHIAEDVRDGVALGVRGTPTYFIGSKKLEGVVPLTVWNDEIIRALQST